MVLCALRVKEFMVSRLTHEARPTDWSQQQTRSQHREAGEGGHERRGARRQTARDSPPYRAGAKPRHGTHSWLAKPRAGNADGILLGEAGAARRPADRL